MSAGAGSLLPPLDAPQPFRDFAAFTKDLLGRGYTRNPCGAHCPDHGGAEHVHLRTPEGEDVMAWQDGRVSGFDLTQPARIIYPAPRRGDW